MITLLFVIGLILLMTSRLVMDKTRNESVYDFFETVEILSVVFSIIMFIIFAVFLSDVVNSNLIDEKIEMYQEENENIESQIDSLVKSYMEYESETFKEFKTDSSITLVSLYPELKSDTLVQTQITTYTENNKKIKELKEEMIMRSVVRWWVYFGK